MPQLPQSPSQRPLITPLNFRWKSTEPDLSDIRIVLILFTERERGRCGLDSQRDDNSRSKVPNVVANSRSNPNSLGLPAVRRLNVCTAFFQSILQCLFFAQAC